MNSSNMISRTTPFPILGIFSNSSMVIAPVAINNLIFSKNLGCTDNDMFLYIARATLMLQSGFSILIYSSSLISNLSLLVSSLNTYISRCLSSLNKSLINADPFTPCEKMVLMCSFNLR